MKRHGYKIFSEGKIANMTLKNRLVRSATGDLPLLRGGKMTDEVLSLYRKLAEGGVGMIITGLTPVVPRGVFDCDRFRFDEIKGFAKLAEVVHSVDEDCKILVQLTTGSSRMPGHSRIKGPGRDYSTEEVRQIIDFFAEAIEWCQEAGFDGVQFHGAHRYFLCSFLSPYTNHRADQYGGTIRKRARIISEIVSKAREKVGNFPILIKMNCTDNVEGGADIDTFPEMTLELERAGVDAIEVSGGMRDCLVRAEEELDFRPIPLAESHTRINSPNKQSYFLRYAEALDLEIPLILVGGNKEIERIEEIAQQGKVDFIALCRPLIAEPELPNRWLEGKGTNTTDCISCNSCLFSLRIGTGLARCLFKKDKEQYKAAQRWLSSWVENNMVK